MRKNKRLTTVAAALSVVLLLTAAKAGDGVITKENGMTVINTTELTRDVKGYQSPTPVKIFIKQNKVVRVEAMPNQETPKFFDRAKAILTLALLGVVWPLTCPSSSTSMDWRCLLPAV